MHARQNHSADFEEQTARRSTYSASRWDNNNYKDAKALSTTYFNFGVGLRSMISLYSLMVVVVRMVQPRVPCTRKR